MLKYFVLRDYLKRPLVHITLIVTVGVLVYSNTIHAPFVLDDHAFIIENAAIKNIDNFTNPSMMSNLGPFKKRYVGYLSFALNYRLNGLDVVGYHIFNIGVHLVNAMLVYFLVVLTFKAPFWSGFSQNKYTHSASLFAGLLFVSHPIQTEAVTYIFQRLASLAAMFYLLSIVLYIKWRLKIEQQKNRKYCSALLLIYCASVLFAILALKTKENAVTLPVVIALYEFFFFGGSKRQRILYLIPLFLTAMIVPLSLIDIDNSTGETLNRIDVVTRGNLSVGREAYLFTQFRVVVTYLRLLLLPINQNIDYDYPVFRTFTTPQVYQSFLLLITLFGSALYAYRRSRKGDCYMRLIALGIMWFLITLSVESSIIPLQRIIHEYRVYLPSAGIFIAATGVVFSVIHKWDRAGRPLLIGLIFLMAILSYTAYSRNKIWRDEVSLWTDVVRKSPRKAGGYMELGVIYKARGSLDRAISYYQDAIRLKPDFEDAHFNLGLAYLEKGLIEMARIEFETALSINPSHQSRRFLEHLNYTAGSPPHF